MNSNRINNFTNVLYWRTPLSNITLFIDNSWVGNLSIARRSVLLSLLLCVLSLFSSNLCFADTASLAVRDTIFKSIGAAQTHIVEQRFEKAQQTLQSTLQTTTNSQEKALVLNALGYCQFIQNNFSKAIEFYQKALKQKTISKGLQYELLVAEGQLYFSIESYSQSILSLEEAISLPAKANYKLHLTLAQSYLRVDDYPKALRHAKHAIALAKSQGIEPKEQWLSLLQTVYLELDEMTGLAKVLEKMVKRSPRKKHWLQLASVYGNLGETQKQLTTLEIARQQNIFSLSKEYVYLAHLYLQADIPYKAAKLLDSEIQTGRVDKTAKNLYLMSQSWLLAQEFEKSIPPLKQAASLDTTGKYYVQLGQIYMSLEQWEDASTAFINGLRQGGLRRPDNAFMALGTALFYQGAYEAARDSFAEASEDKRSNKIAKQWIDYINSTLASHDG